LTKPAVITVPDVELPAPMSCIPVNETPPDQLHVPAGTWTVSPGFADAIADKTFARVHEAALIVAAPVGATHANTNTRTTANHFMTDAPVWLKCLE
jgi:hypothetical protein